jgi:sugar/nucleoside kinase (ribokinase family)
MCRPDDVRRRVVEVVKLADVVKASVEDVHWLYPARPPEQVAAEWLQLGPAVVAITLGAAGSIAVSAEAGAVHVEGQRVDVVDTIGAGDAFNAGLVAAMAAEQEFRDGLQAATTFASEVIARPSHGRHATTDIQVSMHRSIDLATPERRE